MDFQDCQCRAHLKIVFHSSNNVFIVNFDVFISIRSALLVVKAQSMKQLMLNFPIDETSSIGTQCHNLFANFLSYKSLTAAPINNQNVMSVVADTHCAIVFELY